MYEFLDHPSETLVRVSASTIEEVFSDAAIALFEIMTDLSRVKPRRKFHVDLEAPERHLLLLDWLNHLVYLHEIRNVFLSTFAVTIKREARWHLTASAAGEEIKQTHERRCSVKSVTYGQFEWKEMNDLHEVRFVVDI